MKIAVMILSLVMASACGLGFVDNQSGGEDNLPTSGQGPYKKPPNLFDTDAREPYVVDDRNSDDRQPTGLPTDDGFQLWFERSPSGSTASEIWYVPGTSYDELLADVPIRVMSATDAWEEGTVGAPSVIRQDDETLVMFYQGGDTNRAIGRATSVDEGLTWVKDIGNPVLTGAIAPTIAIAEGNWILAYGKPTSNNLFVADSSDGFTFVERPNPLLEPQAEPEAFDTAGLSNPELLVTNIAGQVRYNLFYNGTTTLAGEQVTAIGHLGSFDSQEWLRSAEGEPILHPEAVSEFGPGVIWNGALSMLFFSQERNNTAAIAVAISGE